MVGWISLHRQIQSHWIWKDANKLKWWIDILLTVNNAKAKVTLGNDVFFCERGQSLLSIQSWASRWGVSKDTARNFLKLLEKDGMIKCETISKNKDESLHGSSRVIFSKSTRLTVCKFDSYNTPLRVKQTIAVRLPYPNNNNINSSIVETREKREDIFKQNVGLFLKSEKNPNGKYDIGLIKSFFDYWSEWDNKKNRMRWEMEKTWEISKRLATWQKRDNQFNNAKTYKPAQAGEVGN